MATAVQRLLDEVGLAQRFSQNGRRQVEQYDWKVILPQWERLFETVGGNYHGEV